MSYELLLGRVSRRLGRVPDGDGDRNMYLSRRYRERYHGTVLHWTVDSMFLHVVAWHMLPRVMTVQPAGC